MLWHNIQIQTWIHSQHPCYATCSFPSRQDTSDLKLSLSCTAGHIVLVYDFNAMLKLLSFFSPHVPLYQRWLGIFRLLDPTCRLQSSPAICLGINVTLCQSFLKTQWGGQMTSNLWMTAIWDFVRSLLIQMLVALLACTWKRSCQSINYDVPV